MFQYFLAFLLINTFYQSLGNPVEHNLPGPMISTSLISLANQCENPFLSKQLKNKVDDCSIVVPPYTKRHLQCLIFYDINMQLCTAIAASKLALDGDYLDKINETQDVDVLCETSAKHWVFTNLTLYGEYKEKAEKDFKKTTSCGYICNIEEAIDQANFYCKYYKWGIDMLKSVYTTPNHVNNQVAVIPNVMETDLNVKADIPVNSDLSVSNKPIKQENVATKNQNVQIKQTEPPVFNNTSAKIDEADAADIGKVQTTVQVTSPKLTSSLGSTASNDKNRESEMNLNRLEDPSVVVSDNKSNGVNEEQPAIVNDSVLPETSKNIPVEQKLAVIENPKAKGLENDDYPDSDGNDTVGDDDGDDTGMDNKLDQDFNQNTYSRNKLTAPAHSIVESQKEFYPNTMSDGFSDDGDHFFPFFLTAVILVVLLYVLYHNKSKVGKVFFGLILEGRQGGRRRNSRGHAYRRLDTLEQAMTANTAAPPSKIIY